MFTLVILHTQPCVFCVPMFTLVIMYTLNTIVYPVYPCLPLSYCIPCIPLYILRTHVYLFILYTLYTLKPIMQRKYEIGKMDWSGIELWSTISDPHPSSQYFTVNHRKN